MSRTMRAMFTVTGLALALFASACSSSSSSSTTQGGSASAGSGASASAGGSASASSEAAAAAARVAPYLKAPTSVGNFPKLTGTPPKGKKVYVILVNAGNLGNSLASNFQEAAAALGWQANVQTIDLTNSQAAATAMEQAVANGASYIAVLALDIAQLGPGLTDAKQHNVPVIEMSGGDPAEGKTNGIYASFFGSFKTQEDAMADYMIAQSGADAHVLTVDLPEAQIIGQVVTEVRNHLSLECQACTSTNVNVSFADLANGAVPNEVVAALQKNRSINWVFVPFGQVADGLPTAIKQAGFNVKIVGNVPDLIAMTSLLNGGSQAWAAYAQVEQAYNVMDVAARMSLGMPYEANQDNPFVIFTPQTAPRPAVIWTGPAGYAAQFKSLWGVS